MTTLEELQELVSEAMFLAKINTSGARKDYQPGDFIALNNAISAEISEDWKFADGRPYQFLWENKSSELSPACRKLAAYVLLRLNKIILSEDETKTKGNSATSGKPLLDYWTEYKIYKGWNINTGEQKKNISEEEIIKNWKNEHLEKEQEKYLEIKLPNIKKEWEEKEKQPVKDELVNTKEKLKTKDRYLKIASVVAFLGIVFSLFFAQKSPQIIEKPVDILSTITKESFSDSDSIGFRHLYFRTRIKEDTLLWHFPKLTFFESKNDTTKDIWLVKAENIYRSDNDKKFEPDTTIKHHGFIRLLDNNYYQIELIPTSPEDYKKYGKWHGTFKASMDDLKQLLKKNEFIVGFGGGISKYYQEDKWGVISGYAFIMTKDSTTDFRDTNLLHKMDKRLVKVDRFQNLRITINPN